MNAISNDSKMRLLLSSWNQCSRNFLQILRTMFFVLLCESYSTSPRATSESSAKGERYSLKRRMSVKQPGTFSYRERFYNDPSRANSETLQNLQNFDHFSTRAWSQRSIQASFEHVSKKEKRKIRATSRFALGVKKIKDQRVFGSGLASKMLFYPDRTLGQNQWRGEA